jgi:metal-dependent HD superfamily phosphatase/phosphodiesterase
MPTVLRIGGLRVVIYPNDHGPAHVHVIGGDEEAMFNLHCPDGPPELRENYGFKQSDFSAIIDALSAALTVLCQEWSKIHGAK